MEHFSNHSAFCWVVLFVGGDYAVLPWEILGAVKKEFSTFQSVLDKAQKNIQTASENIDKLIGTRTRAINRKLSAVEILDDPTKSQKLLDLDD